MITVMKWLGVNHLSLSIGKTKIMVFDEEEWCDEIRITDDMYIDECKVKKYLGLMLDYQLRFDDHIEHVKKKITKRIGAMYRSKYLLPIKYRKMFANSLMLPQFDYLDTIYGKASATKLNELDILYKKVAKIALDVPRSESSLSVYKDMKWLPLHLRRQLHLASYMFRIVKGNCPPTFVDKLEYVSGGSRSGTNCDLYVGKSKSLKELKYLGAKCWNNIAVDLRELEDVKVFSKNYKIRLLSSIQEDPDYKHNNKFSNFYKPLESMGNNIDNLLNDLQDILRTVTNAVNAANAVRSFQTS